MVTRLLLAPNRKKFFHHPLNIIDMVSVVPIYITLLFDLTLGSESELGDLGRLIQVGHFPLTHTLTQNSVNLVFTTCAYHGCLSGVSPVCVRLHNMSQKGSM